MASPWEIILLPPKLANQSPMRLTRTFFIQCSRLKPNSPSQTKSTRTITNKLNFSHLFPKPRQFTSSRSTMALPPKFAGQKLLFGQPSSLTAGVPAAVHTLELFLDYVCPFSAKQFSTVYHTVVPLIKANPKWASSLQIIFRQQVQPWHPSSTLVHEAGLAVLQVAPDKYWLFSDALFKDQQSYFDEAVVHEPRNETYKRLAKLAASVGVDEKKVFDLLVISDKVPEGGYPNFGNKVTNDLKVQIKVARLVGVHVSPTVIFDGVVANEISSSWTKEQWQEWLTKSIA
ncbi:uncharacterized protein GGS25DRAFT_505419 [Hypoxylon fragiforme]|uniref:uncharacterized protein n=1 Tax=Hypoxylon fragiforme TaxID=63214 RepID=UPI0020C64482|nr:uncharacterized protein GGS25DRAFT_505419 [Hypoxylon fragiforme]KAI2603776.1 hypothetical protein GGS25DRAFT_505419 [Hypoxylon fragiforme]